MQERSKHFMKTRDKIKSIVKKIVCGTLAAALLVCSPVSELAKGTGMVITAEAAVKKPICAKTQTVYMRYANNPYAETGIHNSTSISGGIYIKNLSSDAKITNIKSSNKKIKVINGFNSSDAFRGKRLWVDTSRCKAGDKSKITFKVLQNGKKYSLSCTVTVKKETSRFEKLSIGGKNYASKVTGYSSRIISLPKNKKVKISVKVKSGMKLSGIYISHNGLGGGEIKNGASVKLNKGDRIYVEYKYTKKPANYSSCLGVAGKDAYLYDGIDIFVK